MVNPIDPIHMIMWDGISTVREREGLVGRGCRKKRMPSSNRTDRGCYVIAEDTQSERMLTSNAGVNEIRVFSNLLPLHCHECIKK